MKREADSFFFFVVSIVVVSVRVGRGRLNRIEMGLVVAIGSDRNELAHEQRSIADCERLRAC